MNEKAKRLWKGGVRYLLTGLAAALLCGLLFYLYRGWPIAGNLRGKADSGKIVSVRVTQDGNETTLTDPENITLAAGTASPLTVSLPGSPSGETPDTEYLFTFTDGGTMRIGASEGMVFRDGKVYALAGDKNCVKLFANMTEALFFPDNAMESAK